MIVKNESSKPGPGEYDILRYLKNVRNSKACARIIKPEIINEHLYEIVGGTQRVLNPWMMTKAEH